MTLRRRDFSFAHFCQEAAALEFQKALDAASTEIWSLREVAKWQGKRTIPLHGTPPRQYYDDLFLIVKLCAGTPLPLNLRAGYLDDAWPLLESMRAHGLIVLDGFVQGSLPPSSSGPRQWKQNTRARDEADDESDAGINEKIEHLSEETDGDVDVADITSIAEMANPLVVVVSRDDVERGDIGPTHSVLARLLESVNVVRSFEERVEIAFHGYDGHRRELYEIPEVRTFVYQLDAQFPYWLFFLTKEGTGLQALAWCFLPPFLSEEGQRAVWPERLRSLLETRWMPALAEVCTRIGFDESATSKRFASAEHYFVEGARLPFDPHAG